MTSISKNLYIDKLNDIVNKYNSIYYRTIKMKPINIKSSTYIDFGIEKKDKEPELATGDHVRVSKYNKIFAKPYTPNCSEGFVIKKVIKIL